MLRWRFLGGGVKSGAGGHQTRQPPQSLLMNLDRRQQQIGIVGPLVVDLVVDDDLVCGFLDLDQLAALGGLGCLAFGNDLGGGLKQTDQLFGGLLQLGPVAAGGIGLAGAAGLAAASGGFRQTALDHGLGGGEELLEELLPTH